MEISQQLRQITGSATAQIFSQAKELEAQGKDIVHLEIGQPDFSPPDVVIEATVQALHDKKTAYTVSRGIAPLRKAIADRHNSENDADLDYRHEVIVTAGAKLGIFGALWSVVNPGDNVIVLNPSWVSYGDIVSSLGAEPRYVTAALDFTVDDQELMANIDHQTKAMIVNSPSNPTGGLITKENLIKLVRICREHEVLLISDEIYSDYLYDEGTHYSLLEMDNWNEVGVVINGFSKTFSMTGFRLGYVLGKSTIIDQVNKVMQLTASCAVNFAQEAAIVALEHIGEMRSFIKSTMAERRQLVVELFHEIGVDFQAPQGAIYAWFKVPSTDSAAWTSKLLEEEGVALTPGVAFGPAGEGYARLCFAVDHEQLRKGITRIGSFLHAH